MLIIVHPSAPSDHCRKSGDKSWHLMINWMDEATICLYSLWPPDARERMMAVVYAGPWPTIEGNKPEEFWNFSFAEELFHHFFSLLVVLIRSTRWLVCPICLNCACWRREKDEAQCWVSFGRQAVCLSRSWTGFPCPKKICFLHFLGFSSLVFSISMTLIRAVHNELSFLHELIPTNDVRGMWHVLRAKRSGYISAFKQSSS